MKKLLNILIFSTLVLTTYAQNISNCNAIVLECKKLAENLNLVEDNSIYFIRIDFLQGGANWIYAEVKKGGEKSPNGSNWRNGKTFFATPEDNALVTSNNDVHNFKLVFHGKTEYPTAYRRILFEFATIDLKGKLVNQGAGDCLGTYLWQFSSTKRKDDTPDNCITYMIKKCSFYHRNDYDMSYGTIYENYDTFSNKENLFLTFIINMMQRYN